MSNFGRVAVVALAIAAAIVLFVVLDNEDDSDEPVNTQATQTTPAPDEAGEDEKPEQEKEPVEEIPRITIVGGQPQGGVQELEFTGGDEIRFEVDSDIAEHVHVHGYDVIEDVEPGKPAVFAFPADIEGVFEVELEDSATPIAELTVNPG